MGRGGRQPNARLTFEVSTSEALQLPAALAQRQIRQRAAIRISQEIKHDQQGGRFCRQLPHPALRRMDALEQVVERERSVLRDDDLAVENKPVSFQTERRLNHVGKIARQRAAGFGLQDHLSPIAKDETTKAVPFGLIQPGAAGGDLVDRERLHRRDGRTQYSSARSAYVPTVSRTFSGARQRPRLESELGWEHRATTKERSGPL